MVSMFADFDANASQESDTAMAVEDDSCSSGRMVRRQGAKQDLDDRQVSYFFNISLFSLLTVGDIIFFLLNSSNMLNFCIPL